MSDLQEIRRFWTIDLSTDWPSGYVRKNGRMRWSVYFDSGWNVKVLWRGNARQGSGGGIAAAMAVAGFGERKKGEFADRNLTQSAEAKAYQHPNVFPDYCRVPPQSRQRPRKGVRLGKRKRKQVREWYTDVFGQSWQ